MLSFVRSPLRRRVASEPFPAADPRLPDGTSLVRGGPSAPLQCGVSGDARPPTMALPFGDTPGAREPRTIAILAKTIYRELRGSGFQARDVMALAGELLSLVTSDVRESGRASRPATSGSGGATPRASGRAIKA
jgi:hypothetical protein